MHIDFSSAIDNARLIAERAAALRRYAQPAVAVQPRSSRWYGRVGGRTAGAAVSVKPVPRESAAHAR
jgi:hypothetical protein